MQFTRTSDLAICMVKVYLFLKEVVYHSRRYCRALLGCFRVFFIMDVNRAFCSL